jgi:hypothetical protein
MDKSEKKDVSAFEEVMTAALYGFMATNHEARNKSEALSLQHGRRFRITVVAEEIPMTDEAPQQLALSAGKGEGHSVESGVVEITDDAVNAWYTENDLKILNSMDRVFRKEPQQF